MTRAAHYTKGDDGAVRCRLCPQGCLIPAGGYGRCLTRRNVDGELEVTTYGRLQAMADDPIEKKPLFHYYPGSLSFSIASAGCNLLCPFCQNSSLARITRCEDPLRMGPRVTPPAQVVAAAEATGAKSISFTYSEPTLQFEYARDVAKAAEGTSVELVFVTNGQINPAPARELAEFIHAANVDLKAFSDASYRDVLGGHLKTTLKAIEILHDEGVWVEVTTLIIPGFNDGDDELTQMARFIRQLDPEIPWHLSRFHPAYKWRDKTPTPIETLHRARNIALECGLRYVYTGNVPGDDGEKTRCPECHAVVIDRRGYVLESQNTADGRCRACGHPIAGVGLR